MAIQTIGVHGAVVFVDREQEEEIRSSDCCSFYMSNSWHHWLSLHYTCNTDMVPNSSEAKHRPTKLDFRTSVDNTLPPNGHLTLPDLENRPRKHQYQKIPSHVLHSIGSERIVVLSVLWIEVAHVRPS